MPSKYKPRDEDDAYGDLQYGDDDVATLDELANDD